MKGNPHKPPPELVTLAAQVVSGTLHRMPVRLRELAEKVPVHYENFADPDVVRQGFEPDILGLFIGEPKGSEATYDNPLPAQIILYLGSLNDFVEGDREAFREETKLTYLHELGHYFGWDEDEVAAHGLE